MIEYVTIIYMPYALCITGRGIIGWVDIPPKGGRFSVGCFLIPAMSVLSIELSDKKQK